MYHVAQSEHVIVSPAVTLPICSLGRDQRSGLREAQFTQEEMDVPFPIAGEVRLGGSEEAPQARVEAAIRAVCVDDGGG